MKTTKTTRAKNTPLFTPYGQEFKVMLVCEPEPVARKEIHNALAAVEFWRAEVANASWFDPEKECLVVLCLDRRNQLKAWNLVSMGTNTSSLAHPREVFRPAIVASACAIVLMHNHPSGNPEPSPHDFDVTRQMERAAKNIGIDIHDHIVVGEERADPVGVGYFSFRMRSKAEGRELTPADVRK